MGGWMDVKNDKKTTETILNIYPREKVVNKIGPGRLIANSSVNSNCS